ncbi:recombinase family protein [Leptodesmis sichuanensis]|uniref:recombinase family protein n=1 Tax=Leptodesmis sichuanensis TaxID=2906798 RepID=UPI001F3CCFD1|nr:recombinase family protein [Leptodesmis sichuanensis]UIE38432.1 recombinase family protein [Leptodesmis sichuanensis A121]
MANHKLTWITGPTRSGKTTQLIQHCCTWVKQAGRPDNLPTPIALPGVLVLAANGDNRIDLDARLTAALQGTYPFHATTPLGFFQDEVTLFWPLLIQQLDLKAQFPVRLNPENEQELATRLWRSSLDEIIARQPTVNEERFVRRLLDLLQLTHLAGIPLNDMPTILQQGLAGQEQELPLPFPQVKILLQEWERWCLERGLLTYGIMTALYWQYLLPHVTYQRHLRERYQMVLADDVDEYPAIARSLFEVLIQGGSEIVFTFNPDGAVRSGLGADPAYLAALAHQCQMVALTHPPVPCLGSEWGHAIVEFVTDPMALLALPEAIQTIQTISRAELLRRVAELIVKAVQSGQVEPREVAVIAPGLDAIARYTLSEILTKHQIPVASLNDQRPLTSFPIIRSLLTLLALIYPGLGRLIDRDAVAEMLVVFTQKQGTPTLSLTPHTPHPTPHTLIDPVRAGLLADYCFAPHPDRPRLLPPTTFPRWDRLGYQASETYQSVLQWIETQKTQLEQRLIPNAVTLLDRAIQHFLIAERTLSFDQLSALRQFIETAQHYWEINNRLKQSQLPNSDAPTFMTVGHFIQLLRNGTVTSNPYPVRPIGPSSNAVTLANVFQYRSNRRAHRWHFWLDAGSPRWLSGVDALFAAPLFLHEWSGRAWTAADALTANEQRLRRILLDLLSRAEERVYLCHSDLATSGQEQTGVLLSLVNAAIAVSG